jgi:integrase/recombinase XerD
VTLPPEKPSFFDQQGKCLYLTAEERAAFMAAARKAPPDVRTLCTVLHDTGYRKAMSLQIDRINTRLGLNETPQ